MSNETLNQEYEFTLVIGNISEITCELEDRLFEAGCDDATISMQQGRVYITFSRRAESIESAILDAVKSVRMAKIGAKILRIDQCDLVTQAEIARRISRSRQVVNMYISGERGPKGFPPPVCNITDESSPLWYWCEVAGWLFENQVIREEDLHQAQVVAILNCILELSYKRNMAAEETDKFMEELCLCNSEDCEQIPATA
ncbi:MAG: hypothetical protein HUJ26_02500 [Planctomycetaceae bacterium]|nr:hypothetical protein [Planctomycetaceae bacterium]